MRLLLIAVSLTEMYSSSVFKEGQFISVDRHRGCRTSLAHRALDHQWQEDARFI